MKSHIITKIICTTLTVAGLNISACQNSNTPNNQADVKKQQPANPVEPQPATPTEPQPIIPIKQQPAIPVESQPINHIEFKKPKSVLDDAISVTLDQSGFEKSLVANKWMLHSAKDIQGNTIDNLASSSSTLYMSGNSQNGFSNSFSAGCNTMGGDISLQGQQITTKLPIFSTLIACPYDLDQLDSKLAGFVTQVSQLSFFRNSETIILKQVTADGTELLWIEGKKGNEQHSPINILDGKEPLTLDQSELADNLIEFNRWSLHSAKDNQGQFMAKFIKPEAQLKFNGTQNNLSNTFSIGCNSMGSEVVLQDQQMTTKLPINTTKIACPDDLEQLDNAFAGLVTQVSQLSLFDISSHMVLRQTTADGTELVWVEDKLENSENPDYPLHGATPLKLNETDSKNMLTQNAWTIDFISTQKNQKVKKFITPSTTLNFNISQNVLSNSFGIGCNTFGGDVTLQGKQMTTKDVMSTKIYCSEKIQQSEEDFAGLVSQNSLISFFKKSDTIILLQVTTDGTELLWVNAVK